MPTNDALRRFTELQGRSPAVHMQRGSGSSRCGGAAQAQAEEGREGKEGEQGSLSGAQALKRSSAARNCAPQQAGSQPYSVARGAPRNVWRQWQ